MRDRSRSTSSALPYAPSTTIERSASLVYASSRAARFTKVARRSALHQQTSSSLICPRCSAEIVLPVEQRVDERVDYRISPLVTTVGFRLPGGVSVG
jgi:uncharacterized protein with PIN domain